MMTGRNIVGVFWNVGRLLATAAMLLAASGCDLTGQYESKFKQALEESKRRSAFDAFLHQQFTEVVDSTRQPIGVKLRLPKQFDAESKVLPQTAIQGLTDIPGSAYTLMKDLDDDSGQKATSIVQIVAVPKAAQKGESIQNMVAKMAATISPAAKWEDVSLPSPSGQPVMLKRMRLEKQMPVMNAKGGGKMVPGFIDTYEIDAGANVVVITWAAQKPQATKHNLERAIEASMGSVEVAAAPGGDAAASGAGGKANTGCF